MILKSNTIKTIIILGCVAFISCSTTALKLKLMSNSKRFDISHSDETSSEILKILAKDKNPYLRGHVAANNNTPQKH